VSFLSDASKISSISHHESAGDAIVSFHTFISTAFD